jgi:hypothetical protein
MADDNGSEFDVLNDLARSCFYSPRYFRFNIFGATELNFDNSRFLYF